MRERSRGPKALARALAKLTAPMFRKRGLADGAIVGEWPAIVGERIAAASAPERVSYPPRSRTGGTLRLRVANSALALELQHEEPQLLERINGFLGYGAVARLKLVHGPLPKRRRHTAPRPRPLTAEEERRLDAALAGIEDEKLHEILDKLGRSVIASDGGRDAAASAAPARGQRPRR